MIRLTFILFFIVNSSIAQSNENFLNDFLLEDELKSENLISTFNKYDYSEIWSQTKNHRVLGIIGNEHQRIKIKFISILKNSSNPNEYIIKGKSNVKGNICDFNGTITLIQIKEIKNMHYGVDNEYSNKGIKSQGILIGEYQFKENSNQKHTGTFKGKVYSKWYLDSTNQIKYDNIQNIADGYMNNAFIGIWKSYSTNKEKICNWADYRVPRANQDFDVGAGEFSPSKKYVERGWLNYQKAWLYNDENAKKEELQEWWK